MAADRGPRTARSAPPHILDIGKTLLAARRVPAGSRVGDYRIDSLIARGGMSEVYKAHDLKLHRAVALKLLPPFMADSEPIKDRFLREARIAASLEHPNVVPIYDAGRRDGALWIAMRYIDGTDLHKLIEQEGPLPIRRTFSILKQIADALDTAHNAGLVHRDVKPQNILVIAATNPRSSDEAFLSDFGLAKALESESRSTSRALMGTVNYISPEQIRGGDVDRRSDVYSLGCVLYECLTGNVPFERDSVVSVLWAHVEDLVPSASDSRLDLPRSVDAVIARSLAKAPEDRFSSCGELVAAYRSALRRKRALTPARALWEEPEESDQFALGSSTVRDARLLRRQPPRVRSASAILLFLALFGSGVYGIARMAFLSTDTPPVQVQEQDRVNEPKATGGDSTRKIDDDSRRTEGTTRRGKNAGDDASLQGLVSVGGNGRDAPVSPAVGDSDQPTAPALTRTLTGEYTGVAADGLAPSDCVGENSVGCVFFQARSDERYLDVRISDKLGASVRVWIRQNYDSDPNHDGEWSMLCNESKKPIPIVPGAEINVMIQRGQCEDGSTSRPSTGTVTASFYSRRP